jgi:hypothetical protein
LDLGLVRGLVTFLLAAQLTVGITCGLAGFGQAVAFQDVGFGVILL